MSELTISSSSGETAESRDRFNNLIAIAVALISAFMAVSKIKDDNIVQAMQKSQAEVIDNWNLYQARTQRFVLVDATVQQTEVLLPAERTPEQTAKLAEWKKIAETSRSRAEEAAKKAKAAQAAYDDMNTVDDMFDLSDALLSVALALFAVTALLRVRWLFGLATVLALGGAFMGSAAFLGWIQFHSDVLSKLLS